MEAKFNEVFDLIHEAIELALKAEALAKASALEVARVKRLLSRTEILNK